MKVVLNLKLFIITFVISLDYLYRIVILARQNERGGVGLD